jgi:hypothetical protein
MDGVGLESTVEGECRFTYALEVILVVFLKVGKYFDEI